MSFSEAISSGFKNYANFNGRASRSAYWFWQLFTFLILVLPSIWYSIESSTKEGFAGTVLFAILSLALVIPGITVEVRRLHDLNRSGAWWWFRLVPVAGSIVIFIFMLMPSVDEGNRFND